jgi:N-acetylglucosamine-6-phosphate deacetylase
LGDGSYELGALSVSVVDGVARTSEGSLAGSTLSSRPPAMKNNFESTTPSRSVF